MNVLIRNRRLNLVDLLYSRKAAMQSFVLALLCIMATLAAITHVRASAIDDRKVLTALDTEYQAAVQRNDANAMDRLLADDFVLVTGAGRIYSKADLLEEARSGRMAYESQQDREQSVRVWGNTAVVTAKLWAKGTESGKPFEYKLWFSDTYVRRSQGWQYVFGQSSLPLPRGQW